jgi:hypothetical protein
MTAIGQPIQYFIPTVSSETRRGEGFVLSFRDMGSGMQQQQKNFQRQQQPQLNHNLPPQQQQRQQRGGTTPPGSRASSASTAKAAADAGFAAEAAEEGAKKGKSGWGLGSMVGRLIGKKDEMEGMHADEMSMYFDEKLNKWVDPSNLESLEPAKPLAPPSTQVAAVRSFTWTFNPLISDVGLAVSAPWTDQRTCNREGRASGG